MNDKFYNSLGLCRRAKKLCIGHDEVKASVTGNKAKLILITSDASERIESEMNNIKNDIQLLRLDVSMDDMGHHIGRHSGIFSVTDTGLSNLVLSTLKEDSIHGTN